MFRCFVLKCGVRIRDRKYLNRCMPLFGVLVSLMYFTLQHLQAHLNQHTWLHIYFIFQHLQAHLNQHTGDTPFKCDSCPAQFRNSGTMCKHKQKYHGYKTTRQVGSNHHQSAANPKRRKIIVQNGTEQPAANGNTKERSGVNENTAERPAANENVAIIPSLWHIIYWFQ